MGAVKRKLNPSTKSEIRKVKPSKGNKNQGGEKPQEKYDSNPILMNA
jgi:hypothetical protein